MLIQHSFSALLCTSQHGKHQTVVFWIVNSATLLEASHPHVAWGLSCGKPRILIISHRTHLITHTEDGRKTPLLPTTTWRNNGYQSSFEYTMVINHNQERPLILTTKWIHHAYQPPSGETTVTNHHIYRQLLPTTTWGNHYYQPPYVKITVTNHNLEINLIMLYSVSFRAGIDLIEFI